jgi:dTMP kinase
MITRPLFISVDGADGAGKGEAIEYLRARLQDFGAAVHTTREPGGCPAGEVLRTLFKSAEMDLTPVTRLLIMQASRLEHIDKTIKPALKAGKVVLTDRFFDSSAVLQVTGDGLGTAYKLLEFLPGLGAPYVRPDYTVFLSVTKQTCMARQAIRGMDFLDDKWNKKNLCPVWDDHFAEVSKMHPERIFTVDANQDLQGVRTQLDVFVQQLDNESLPHEGYLQALQGLI